MSLNLCLYTSMAILSVFLLGYSLGRRTGKREGIKEGLALAPIEMQRNLLTSGVCPLCQYSLKVVSKYDNIPSKETNHKD